MHVIKQKFVVLTQWSFAMSKSQIRDVYPGSGFFPARIPDLEVIKHWLPDPGSGSATLLQVPNIGTSCKTETKEIDTWPGRECQKRKDKRSDIVLERN